MVNPYAGEVALRIGSETLALKLTLGALAELETVLQDGSLLALVERFEAGRFSARDISAVLLAGLRGGGHKLSAAELADADIAGGPLAAARVAAELLARAFAVPDASA